MYGLDKHDEEYFVLWREQSTEYLIESLRGLALMGKVRGTHQQADIILQVFIERFLLGIARDDLVEQILTAYNDIPKRYF